MKKVLIATVSAVAIFWLTQGVIMLWPVVFPPKTPPPPPPANVSFNGRVIDSDKRTLLAGAEVSFGVLNTVTTDHTDSDGRYAFSIPKPAQPIVAVLRVSAQGYQPYTRQLPSENWDQSEQDLFIEPLPATVQPPPPSPQNPAVQQMKKAEAVAYRPRNMPAMVKLSPALVRR